MNPEDVKDYYGSLYKFNNDTGMSASSLGNWLRWGYVPESAQLKIERLTSGKLKSDDFSTLKKCESSKRISASLLKEDLLRLESMMNDNNFVDNKILAQCLIHLIKKIS